MGNRNGIYDAEDELIGPVTWYASVEGVQFDVNRFIARKWWKERSPVTKVDIQYPVVGSGAIRLSDTHWRIGYHSQSVCNLNVAHELTHVLMGVTVGVDPEAHEQDHSAHFAGAELEVVRRFCSPALSRRLRQEFEAQDVEVAPYPREATPEPPPPQDQ